MKIATHCVCCAGSRLRRSPAVLMPFIAFRIFGWQPVEITEDFGLRDLSQGNAYSVCNSLGCEDCGLLFLDMRFDGEEMGALYQGYRGPDYTSARERFEPGYVRRNDILVEGSTYIGAVEEILAPHVGTTPRVLDWGGDTGLNTPFKGKASLHHVYEISDKPPIAGAEMVSLDQVRSQSYDLIVSSQVLEHVPSPAESLKEMAAVMRPETLLYLEVPREDLVRNVSGLENRLRAKRHWHEHVNFFTEDAIAAMMQAAGLTPLSMRSHPVSAGGKTSHVFSVLARLGG
jgi:SAM-dependent methyltransferase